MAGAYHPLRRVATGATGEVWLARGPSGNVALKRAVNGASLANEAAALRAVHHPAVVRLLDADPNGRWLATEYAPGGSCREFAKDRSLREVIAFVAEVADGLAAIHGAGLLHGDLKPANVLVGPGGSPRIVDLCGGANDHHGTPGWVAPERLRGAPASAAADVYGLGTILYTLLTGRGPFEGAEESSLSWLPLSTLPEPPSATRPALPRALDDLALQLLAREPAARPARSFGVAQIVWSALRHAPRRPVVGMPRERLLLRQAIVSLLDGTGGIVVLHGPRGSGRGTLLREAARLARRQGLRVAETHGPHLRDGVPTVLCLDRVDPDIESLLVDLLVDRAPVLAIARSERPLTRLADAGARHLSPPPLRVEDVARLGRCWGVDAAIAPELHAQTGGTPSAVLRRLAGYAGAPARLEPDELRVLRALEGLTLTVHELARQLDLGAHRLLDVVEPLCDQGLIACSADGSRLTGPPRAK